VYNDEIDAATLLQQINQGLYHNIVISPGPGTPTAASDIGLCLALIQAAPPIPILGVCLGFQALALAYGARISRASEPVHGRLSAIRHSGTHPLFFGIPSGQSYQVVRYHSLIVDESKLPDELEPIAWTAPGGHHALGLDCPDGNSSGIFSTLNSTRSSSDTSSSVGEGVLMAVAHTSLPYYGVQYHPESVGTAYGHELFKNFKEITLAYYHDQLPHPAQPTQPLAMNGHGNGHGNRHGNRHGESVVNGLKATIDGDLKKLKLPITTKQQQQQRLHVHFKKVSGVLAKINAQTIFDSIVLQNNNNNIEDTFWLDTAAVDRGRFSFMGQQGGALWRRISYKLLDSRTTTSRNGSLDIPIEAANGHSVSSDTTVDNTTNNNTAVPMSPTARESGGVLTSIDKNGARTNTVENSIWDWLNTELQRWKSSAESEEEDSLPFDFCGGLIGYLGYELKADGCGGKAVHTATAPDASFFLVDQFVALDHKTGSVYAVAVHSSSGCSGSSCSSPTTRSGENNKNAEDDDDEKVQAELWVNTIAAQIEQLKTASTSSTTPKEPPRDETTNGSSTTHSPPPPLPSFELREPKAQYIQNVESCMEALYAGDSYELCLTTEMRRSSAWGASEAWTLYKILRRVNPAPYAAWLQFGGGDERVGDERVSNNCSLHPLSICCSSPERFLKGDKTGGLEAKPIKGTARRHPKATPEEDAATANALAYSEKDRAENLMIVDLLRNDLGRVCDPGTVHVPALMNIESFATVHQLVSTVRGVRRKDASVADAVRAAFPGGSMTGAPKVRSMDIIDTLEKGPRGVYSGSLGYFSFNGTFDLNIVIRTAVVHDGLVRIGAGGAIVVQSESEAEYDEMQLKAAALLEAVSRCDLEILEQKNSSLKDGGADGGEVDNK
jgi:para-aminobenzoate synthetase